MGGPEAGEMCVMLCRLEGSVGEKDRGVGEHFGRVGGKLGLAWTLGIRFHKQLHQHSLNQRNNANTESHVDIGFPHGCSDTLAQGNFHY